MGGAASGNSGAGSAGRRRKHRRVVRQGTERDVISGVSRDEVDTEWAGQGSGAGGSRDAEILGDVPPHFGKL